MIVGAKLGYIYLNPPKTASSTIARILHHQFEGKSWNDRHDNQLPDYHPDRCVFATIRNPYARALSGYSYVRGNSLGWEEAWRRFHTISLTDYFTHILSIRGPVRISDNWMKYIVGTREIPNMEIVKVENLEEGFRKLPFVGDKPVNFEHRNKGRYRNPDKIPVDRICEFVATRYKNDFDNFGYDINDLSPIDRFLKNPLTIKKTKPMIPF